MSEVEAAVEVGRRSVGDLPKDSPKGRRRVLLRDWQRPEPPIRRRVEDFEPEGD